MRVPVVFNMGAAILGFGDTQFQSMSKEVFSQALPLLGNFHQWSSSQLVSIKEQTIKHVIAFVTFQIR